MHAPSVWLRVGGIAVTGAAVIACATSARAGSPPSPRHAAARHSTPPASPADPVTGSSSSATTPGASPVPAGGVTASGGTRQASPASLGPNQLAGQRVIYSYSGLTPPGRLLWLIRHGEAAGVIFFGQNISGKTQIAGVIGRLKKADAAKTNPVRTPLLLMTDQEGGEVRRLPGAPVLSEKQIGQSAHPEAQATAAGSGAATNLLSVGMNVNLAPVLDVFRKPGDFDDQFQRSYSSNPKVASRLGADFIRAQQRAQQKGKVAATAKHFPGLGAATSSQNTDERPVTLNVSLTHLRNIDEFPYKAAIVAGVKLVMASWAVYPALDKSRPAGLSRTIVTGELRKRLGFKGVTITDALEAGALKAFGPTGNRAVLAANAGMDLILCSAQNVAQGVACRDGLANGYRNGSLNKTGFKNAVALVQALRASLRK